jgi:hypothetical protein
MGKLKITSRFQHAQTANKSMKNAYVRKNTKMSDRYIVCSLLGNTLYVDDVELAKKEAINESITFRTTAFVYDTHHPSYGNFNHYEKARIGCFRNGKEVEVKYAQ